MPKASDPKAILVIGATGKQGGSVVRALLAHRSFSPSKYTILAATRDPASNSAKSLAALSPAVQPVVGDMRDPASMFRRLPCQPWAAFAVTYPGKTEAADGIGAVDGAVAQGASHVVFSSVDRGVGSPPTDVPHFVTKHKVEAHLRDVAARSTGGKLSYTILRPPFFLDNLEPGFFGRVTATMWRDYVDRPLSLIDTTDIGAYAAAALLEPDSPKYHNAELDIAGDRLTFNAANSIFRQRIGQDLPTTYSFMAAFLIFLSTDFRKMVHFFQNEGFASTPDQSNLHPMTSFSEWVARSQHTKKSA